MYTIKDVAKRAGEVCHNVARQLLHRLHNFVEILIHEARKLCCGDRGEVDHRIRIGPFLVAYGMHGTDDHVINVCVQKLIRMELVPHHFADLTAGQNFHSAFKLLSRFAYLADGSRNALRDLAVEIILRVAVIGNSEAFYPMTDRFLRRILDRCAAVMRVARVYVHIAVTANGFYGLLRYWFNNYDKMSRNEVTALAYVLVKRLMVPKNPEINFVAMKEDT